jgi:hypothetical protein
LPYAAAQWNGTQIARFSVAAGNDIFGKIGKIFCPEPFQPTSMLQRGRRYRHAACAGTKSAAGGG